MILGVALVVNELNKGQRMIFRYPESIPTSIINSSDKGLIKLYNQYFGFSLENLAKLFRPKNALLSKVLEISIDDLCFISYPCQCHGLTYDEAASSGNGGSEAGLPSASANTTLGPLNSPIGLYTAQSGGNSSGEVITMFNVIVTCVSSKAMRKINPEFVFKCMYKYASKPGTDPIASALGLRNQSYGICRETIRRLVETVAIAMLQQEKSCRYVTEQVTLMLRIMDNWSLSKQLDASSNGSGPVVMESGLGAAMAVNLDAGGFESVTPSFSRINSNRPGHLMSASSGISGVDSIPGQTILLSTEGSLKSTPRSSRSSSNAALVETVAPVLSTSSTPPASTLTSAPAPRASNTTLGGGAGVAVVGAVAGNAGGSEAPVQVVTGIGGAPRVTRANGSIHLAGTSGVDGPDCRLQDEGIAHALSIDTEFTEGNLDASSTSTSARLPSNSLQSSSGGSYSAHSSVFPSLEVPSLSPNSSTTVTPSTATDTPQRTLPAAATAAVSATVANQLAEGSGKNSPSFPTTFPTAYPPSHSGDLSTPLVHGLHSTGSASSAASMYAHSFGGPQSSTSSNLNPGTPLTHSRASSGLTGLGPTSRTASGVSTTPSKQSSLLGSGVAGADSLGGAGGKDKRSTEWGAHLMTDFIALSQLANELRVLYHNIIGGHSVNVSFNGVKSVNVPLFCNDRRICEDCLYLKSMNCMATGIEALGLQHLSPSANLYAPSNGVSVNLGGAGAGRARQPASPYVRPPAQGQLNSALSNFHNNNAPHSARKNSKDAAKIKGFNLNTQTMLTIADTDTIMNILQSVDSSNFSIVASLSDSSLSMFGGVDFGGEGSSSGDLASLKHQQQLRNSSRLVSILEAADPTQSFLDLSLTLDEPVEELLTTANYLRSWGLAEVIPVIYSRSCFRVHSKAVLNRDSPVGRAFEALLLSFDVQVNERTPQRNETIDRLNSENFLPGADILYDGAPKDISPVTKKRSSSIASHEGSHDSLRQYAASHGFGGQTTGAVPINGAHAAAPASAHYLVSPAVSKYRQRRETREKDREDPQNSLRNSRSSEHFFKNMLTTSQSLTGGEQPSPPVPVTVLASRAARDVTPTRAHSLSVSATSSVPISTKAPLVSNSTIDNNRSATDSMNQNQVRGGRERVNSYSAAESKDYRHTSAPAATGFGALVSAFFGQAASHASQVRKQRETSSASATPTITHSDAQRGASSFREVDGHRSTSRVKGDSSRIEASSASQGDGGAGEVVQNQASSYPPSALGTLNISSANREHGFQHVISLAEVGGVTAPLIVTPLIGGAPVDDTVYTIIGRSGFPGEELALFDDLSAPPLVHCLDVADNIPVQYCLPALLAAFNGARVLQEVLELWPEPLREFSVEIVVFLLRWHEIVPVDSYIVNLLHLTDPRHATTELSCTAISTAAGAKNKALHTPAASRVGSKVNFALGTAHGESAYSTSPTHYSSAQGLYRGGYSESKTNLSALEEAILPLRENLPRSLSAQEVAIVEKIFPFIVNTAMSSKTLGEIVWMVRVAEEELVQVIEKVPYLQVVKKISV